MKTLMVIVGAGLIGLGSGPIFSLYWFFSMAGCAVLIMAFEMNE